MSYCKYNFRGTNVNNATQSCKKTNKQSENSENCELSSKSGRCNLTAKIKKEFNWEPKVSITEGLKELL